MPFAPGDVVVALTYRGRVRLMEPVTWHEPRGESVTVPVGFVSDGVTVPPLAWPLIGHPLSGMMLRAALLHDWELVLRERPAAAVHRRFHDALRASGVGRVRAWLCYTAARLFGPRW